MRLFSLQSLVVLLILILNTGTPHATYDGAQEPSAPAYTNNSISPKTQTGLPDFFPEDLVSLVDKWRQASDNDKCGLGVDKQFCVAWEINSINLNDTNPLPCYLTTFDESFISKIANNFHMLKTLFEMTLHNYNVVTALINTFSRPLTTLKPEEESPQLSKCLEILKQHKEFCLTSYNTLWHALKALQRDPTTIRARNPHLNLMLRGAAAPCNLKFLDLPLDCFLMSTNDELKKLAQDNLIAEYYLLGVKQEIHQHVKQQFHRPNIQMPGEAALSEQMNAKKMTLQQLGIYIDVNATWENKTSTQKAYRAMNGRFELRQLINESVGISDQDQDTNLNQYFEITLDTLNAMVINNPSSSVLISNSEEPASDSKIQNSQMQTQPLHDILASSEIAASLSPTTSHQTGIQSNVIELLATSSPTASHQTGIQSNVIELLAMSSPTDSHQTGIQSNVIELLATSSPTDSHQTGIQPNVIELLATSSPTDSHQTGIQPNVIDLAENLSLNEDMSKQSAAKNNSLPSTPFAPRTPINVETRVEPLLVRESLPTPPNSPGNGKQEEVTDPSLDPQIQLTPTGWEAPPITNVPPEQIHRDVPASKKPTIDVVPHDLRPKINDWFEETKPHQMGLILEENFYLTWIVGGLDPTPLTCYLMLFRQHPLF